MNGLWDELFLRPLDVHACLTGRAYGDSASSVPIAIPDPLFADNNRTFVISAEGARPTEAAADITASVTALGATLLGGRSWATQAAIGEAQGSPDALRAAGVAFEVETIERVPAGADVPMAPVRSPAPAPR